MSDDTNGCTDIFVYDQDLNTTKLVSVSSTGEQGDGDSYSPSISADGQYIAYASDADNLVSDDTNGCTDIFVYDQDSNTTKLVSVSSTGEQGDGDSSQPSISGDGNYIAFTSDADNLVPNDTTGYSGVFVYDQSSGQTECVSLQTSGEEIDEDSLNPSISTDGNYVAFVVGEPIRPEIVSIALDSTNLKNNDINTDEIEYYNYNFIYVHNIITGTTNKVSVSSTGDDADNSCNNPSINADGSIIAFSSTADNLVPNDTNYCSDIFTHTDNNINYLSGTIIPNTVKSGDSVTITASSENATSITAQIFNKNYNLTKLSNGGWGLDYIIPNISDGNYSALLTATDSEGNIENLTLYFSVYNTPPTITGTITPNIVKSGDEVEIDASSNRDLASIWVSICGENVEMNNNQDGTWSLDYYLPDLSDGNYPVILTATDKAGNQCTASLNFTVDNDPPVISGSLTPDTVETYDNITITANSNPNVTSITALILNQTYNLIEQTDRTWKLQYTVPYVPDGNYPVVLTATDNIGNTGIYSLNFNVFNPITNVPPTVTGTITHTNLLNGASMDGWPVILINAFANPDTISVIASIENQNYTLTRQADGSWYIGNVNWLAEGTYTALLTATDWSGNQGTSLINFNVDNIIPTVNTTSFPQKLKSGDILTLNVTTSPDALSVYASTPSGNVNLQKQSNGIWNLQYIVPKLNDGDYSIGITSYYGTGWLDNDTITFIRAYSSASVTVDNTPPNIAGTATPSPIRTGDILKIRATCTSGSYYIPDDTANVTATLLGQTFNMTKISTWSTWYSNPKDPNSGNSGTDWSTTDFVVPESSRWKLFNIIYRNRLRG